MLSLSITSSLMMTPEDGHIQDGVLEVDENQISPFALFSHENGYRATVKSLKQNWKRKLNRLNYLFFKSWMKGLSWSLEQEGNVFEGRGGWWVWDVWEWDILIPDESPCFPFILFPLHPGSNAVVSRSENHWKGERGANTEGINYFGV